MYTYGFALNFLCFSLLYSFFFLLFFFYLVFFSRSHTDALQKVLKEEAIVWITRQQQASNHTPCLATFIVIDSGGFFQVCRMYRSLYRGENIVTTRSGARDGLMSNDSLRWRLTGNML